MLRSICLISALLLAQTGSANERVDRNCSDDRGQDRCGQVAQANTRDRYGLVDIDKMAANGAYVRRAMIVDGYGNDVLAVSFIREKGKDPFVEIRGPMSEGRKDHRSVVMPISISEWNEVRSKGAYFDRDLASTSKENGGTELTNICLHSWMVIVEAADPSRLSSNTLPAMGEDANVRRKTQSACNGGLAVEYAFQLVDFAYEMLPVCQSVDVEFHRNKAMALNTCLLLSGDKAAAGQAVSLSNSISRALNLYPKDRSQTEKALIQLVVLPEPNDRPRPGQNEISQSKRAEIVELLQQGRIYNHAFTGVDADHVEIDAIQVQHSEDPNATNWPQRKIRIFASQEAGKFRIYRVDATSFDIVRKASDKRE